jgi:phosphoglycolate phosphatase
MSKQKVILFDFDGTLADTLDKIIEGYNKRVAPALRTKPLNYARIPEYRRSATPRSFLKEHGISLAKLPIMIYWLRRYLRKEMHCIQFCKGMEEVLDFLHKQKYRLGVLTSNSVKNVGAFLRSKERSHYFDYIYSAKKWHGKDRTLRKMIADHELSIQNLLYIGDEVRDIEFARKVGIPIICVSWGLNDRGRLEAHEPDFLVDSPEELMAVLEEHF